MRSRACRSIASVTRRGAMRSSPTRATWRATSHRRGRRNFALVGFLGADFVQAVRARRNFEPQVVHAHWWFPSGVVGTWVGGLSHVPLVTTLHGTDVRLARSVGVAKPLFGHVLKHSAAVTTVSSWLKDKTQELAPEVNPIIAPMPVSTDLFFPAGRAMGNAFFSSAGSCRKRESTICFTPLLR